MYRQQNLTLSIYAITVYCTLRFLQNTKIVSLIFRLRREIPLLITNMVFKGGRGTRGCSIPIVKA